MFDIVITSWHEHLTLFGFADNKIEYLEILDAGDRTGNIYVGRVENIVSNLNAAFVRFEAGVGKHGIGFLSLKSLPKESVLNRDIKASSELRPGDIVLVQISTEEMKLKQAKLTGRINLQKAGIDGDYEKLLAIAKTRSEYQRLNKDNDEISAVVSKSIEFIRSLSDDSDYKIVTDIESVYDEIAATKNFQNLELYNEEEKRLPLYVHYSITSKTDDLLKKKVWLNSGAFLIIEQTETLNLIDVNSGKNLKKNDEFFLELNKEAAKEAYRQIRLRNLSGMILIDFVSLKGSGLRDKLIEYIRELIKDDPMKLTFIDITGLGIIEFTRDKRKKSLRETIDIRKM